MTNSVKLLERLSGGPPYYSFKANDQIGFSLFCELYLVLVATSAKVDGPTSGEYATALGKFSQVSKVSVSLSYKRFKSIG